jgi:hypothetical protein
MAVIALISIIFVVAHRHYVDIVCTGISPTSVYKCGNYRYTLGHAVTQLVESLRYKPEGRGFYSRWCHWNFSFT